MINKNLISPRNFIVIGIMTMLAHIVARPLYNMVDKKGDTNDG